MKINQSINLNLKNLIFSSTVYATIRWFQAVALTYLIIRNNISQPFRSTLRNNFDKILKLHEFKTVRKKNQLQIEWGVADRPPWFAPCPKNTNLRPVSLLLLQTTYYKRLCYIWVWCSPPLLPWQISSLPVSKLFFLHIKEFFRNTMEVVG